MPGTAPRRKKADTAAQEIVPSVSVSPALFEKFQQLIHQETGIWLGATKMALLCGRLSRRLRVLGISGLEEYFELVAQPEHFSERVAMIDAITTNETRFFREAKHFKFLEARVIPWWLRGAQQGLRPKTIRVWSAACSSGEEPYSVAMLLAAHLMPEQDWNVTILATDISTRMLERARAGIYEIAKSADIPERLLKSFMLKGIAKEEGQMKVMPRIQEMVEFQRLNLAQGPYPPNGYFDLILCRNVLIYFDIESKHKVVERLTRCLTGGGLLFLGHAENLSGIRSPLRSLAPAIYARAGGDTNSNPQLAAGNLGGALDLND